MILILVIMTFFFDVYRIDMLYEGARDFIGIFMAYGFAGYEEFLEKAKSGMPRYLNVFNQVKRKTYDEY